MFVHTLVRKNDGVVVGCFEDYNDYRRFIKNHFTPKQYEDNGVFINLKTKSYVYNCSKVDRDYWGEF